MTNRIEKQMESVDEIKKKSLDAIEQLATMGLCLYQDGSYPCQDRRPESCLPCLRDYIFSLETKTHQVAIVLKDKPGEATNDRDK